MVDGLDVPVRIASSWSAPEPLPSNVTCALLSHAEYVQQFLAATSVVVPIRRAVRSAGQQTYLGAMFMGKPVVVTDAHDVRDYVQDGETGLIVDPRPESLRQAIQWVTDPANRAEVEKMTEKARAVVEERFLMRDLFRSTLGPFAVRLARRLSVAPDSFAHDWGGSIASRSCHGRLATTW